MHFIRFYVATAAGVDYYAKVLPTKGTRKMLEFARILEKPLMGLGALFAFKIAHDLYYHDWHSTQQTLYRDVLKLLLKLPKIGPEIQKQIDKDLTPMLEEIEADVASVRDLESKFNHLSLDTPPSEQEILGFLDKLLLSPEEDYKYSGAIYCPQHDEGRKEFLKEVYQRSQYTNPLHPDIWPRVQECSAQVVNMCLEILKHPNPKEAFGSISPGGTFGIIEACKAYVYRDQEQITLAGKLGRYFFNKTPEIIVPSTAHAAFDKAAKLFGAKLVKIPVDPVTQKADLNATEAAITKNTIFLVGSAPSYPTGTMDDIKGLGQLARRHNIGLHVDVCLGGFVIPFLEDFPHAFNFEDVEEASSYTLCTHKQGGGEKGTSVVVYRSRKELGQYQISTHMDWLGGLYATPGLGGSASGAAMVNAWAIMHRQSVSGYKADAAAIRALVVQAKEFIDKDEHLEVLGSPDANVIAIHSTSINIHAVADQLKARGWHFNVLPNGIHFCMTGVHINKPRFFEEFSKDLDECAQYVKAHPELKAGGDGAIYGATKKIPNVFSPLKELMAKEYIGTQWRVDLESKGSLEKKRSSHT